MKHWQQRRKWPQGLRVATLLSASMLACTGNSGAHTSGMSSSVAETSERCGLARGLHEPRSRPQAAKAALLALSRSEALNVLGLQDGASEAEVRKAFRASVKAVHPDRGGDAERFHLLKQAYDVASGKVAAAFPSSRPRWAPASHRRHGREQADVGDGFVGEAARSKAWRWAGVADDTDAQDLKKVWESMGFDPFTGTYYGEPDPAGADYIAKEEQQSRRETASAPPRGAAYTMVSELLSAAIVAVIALMMVMSPVSNVDADLSSVAPSENGRWYGPEYAFMARAAKASQAPLLLVNRQQLPRGTSDSERLKHRAVNLGRHLVAAMDESKTVGFTTKPKFNEISVVVDDIYLQDVLQFLTDEDSSGGMRTVQSSTVCERPLMQLGRPSTGQKVLLVGAESDPYIGKAIQDLDSALGDVRADLVLLDMSQEAFEDRSEEFSVWAGHELRHGVDLISTKPLNLGVTV